MKKIIIETEDGNYLSAIAGLCHVANFQSALPEDASDADKFAEKEAAAKLKLVDMIGQTINAHQNVVAAQTIAGLLTSMNQTTTVTVESV